MGVEAEVHLRQEARQLRRTELIVKSECTGRYVERMKEDGVPIGVQIGQFEGLFNMNRMGRRSVCS